MTDPASPQTEVWEVYVLERGWWLDHGQEFKEEYYRMKRELAAKEADKATMGWESDARTMQANWNAACHDISILQIELAAKEAEIATLKIELKMVEEDYLEYRIQNGQFGAGA